MPVAPIIRKSAGKSLPATKPRLMSLFYRAEPTRTFPETYRFVRNGPAVMIVFDDDDSEAVLLSKERLLYKNV